MLCLCVYCGKEYETVTDETTYLCPEHREESVIEAVFGSFVEKDL